MIIRKMNKDNTNLKDKNVYFLRMNLSAEQKQAIIDYGEAKWALGYKEGYISGIISGVLLGTIAYLTFSIIRK
jgi:hypothetical protein